MRTTLTIDDDVLAAAQVMADQQRRAIGDVISDLARKALARPEQSADYRNGIKLLPVRPNAKPVTVEHVKALMDESY